MIDAGDIVLRKRGEQGPNISKNPLPEHKDVIGAITTNEKVEVGLSQLFIAATCEDELPEDMELPTIPEGIMIN